MRRRRMACLRLARAGGWKIIARIKPAPSGNAYLPDFQNTLYKKRGRDNLRTTNRTLCEKPFPYWL